MKYYQKGVDFKVKKIVTLVTMLMLAFTVGLSSNPAYAQEKYPDNSSKRFVDVNTFYKSLDKSEYTEYKNAKMNIREKVFFKDINKVLSRADHLGGQSRVGGDGYNPKRQVYVFLTVSEDGKDSKHIVVDAERKVIIAAAAPLKKP